MLFKWEIFFVEISYLTRSYRFEEMEPSDSLKWQVTCGSWRFDLKVQQRTLQMANNTISIVVSLLKRQQANRENQELSNGASHITIEA